MRVNPRTVSTAPKTHGGAVASRIPPTAELRRSVMACLLWENEFYESGESIADRISSLVPKCDPAAVEAMAIEARSVQHLRHVPLKLCVELARIGKLTANTLAAVIQRPDELSEFLAIYWKNGRTPLSAQVKRGLAAAFTKFNEYSLAKYNQQNRAVKLRDVMRLVHPKPVSKSQAALWGRLVKGTLEVPDTWEVALSSGADKRATWERLLAENKLGGLAFLRNLRNMQQAGVSKEFVRGCSEKVLFDRVLPFRFISAARAVPAWEDIVETWFLRAASQVKLPGKTILIVDVSGSMYGGRLSGKSDMTRTDVAGALAAIIRECSPNADIYATAGSDAWRTHATMLMPPRRGFALVDLVAKGMPLHEVIGGGGIFLTQCLQWIARDQQARSLEPPDRVIVLTDEQDCDTKLTPASAPTLGRHNYIINVASAKNGIAFDRFTTISGWSEAVLNYIQATETV